MGSTDLHAEWTAYVRDVRDRCADLAPQIIGATAEKWHQESRGTWKCCSPLRKERTPSFYLYPDGGWHDYGTNESGDLFSFLQKRDALDFKGAVEAVAAEAGLTSWDERKKARGGASLNGAAAIDEATIARLWAGEAERQKVRETCTAIAYLCHRALPTRVRAHLRDHYGFTDDFIDLEKIGWVPAGLYEFCKEQLPFTDEELLKTGHFVQPGGAGSDIYPLFSQQILFLYWKDGFAEYAIGRTYMAGVSPDDPTYVAYLKENAWDKAKYKKQLTHSSKHTYVSPHVSNEIFWGEDCLKNASRDQSLLQIEGITDAMIAKMIGFHCISPVTTSPSDKQCDRLKAFARKWREVIIVNDNEENRAGEKGAIRCARILWDAKIVSRLATLPRGSRDKIDVNEFVVEKLAQARETSLTYEDARDEAKAALQEVLDEAIDLPAFLVQQIPSDIMLGELETKLKELGAIAQRLTPMQVGDLWTRILQQVPKIPKRDARKVYDEARKAEAKRLLKETSGATPSTGTPEEDKPEPEKREPTNRIQSPVFEDIGAYEREQFDKTRVRISTFSLVLKRVILSDEGPEMLVCEVVGASGETLMHEWMIPPKAWIGKKAFITTFPSARMQWMGTDEEVQAVHELLTKDGFDHVRKVRGTGVMGYHEVQGQKRFVLPAGILDEHGNWMTDPDFVYTPIGGTTIQNQFPKVRADLEAPRTLETAREVLTQLFHCHAPDVIIPLAAWGAACPFKPRLRAKTIDFPICNLHGTFGGGKSSIMTRLVWPMFAGVTEPRGISIKGSPFVYLKDFSSSNAVPLVIDEFKKADLGKHAETFPRFVRSLYTGEVEGRGRMDQGINMYAMTAPLCVIGESKLDNDGALQERCLYIHSSQNWIDQHPGNPFERLVAKTPVSVMAPLYQAWTLAADLDAMLERARAALDLASLQVDATAIRARVKKNLLVCFLGFECLEAFAASLDVTLPAIDRTELFGTLLRNILGIGKNNPITSYVPDSLDHCIVDAGVMANTKRLTEGVHYAWVDGLLFLYVRAIEVERAAWCRDQGLALTSPGHKELMDIAEEKLERGHSYIVKASHRVRMLSAHERSMDAWNQNGIKNNQTPHQAISEDDEKMVRGILIDPKRIPRSLGMDYFPCEYPRGNGGNKRAFVDKPS